MSNQTEIQAEIEKMQAEKEKLQAETLIMESKLNAQRIGLALLEAAREQATREQIEAENIVCVLCGDVFECDYGHNPYPLSKTGLCCNDCNKFVIQILPVFIGLEEITTGYVMWCIYEFKTKHKVRVETTRVVEYEFQNKLNKELPRIRAKIERISELIHLSAAEGRMAIMDIFAKQLKTHKAFSCKNAELKRDYLEGIKLSTLLYEVELNEIYAEFKINQDEYLTKTSAKKLKEAENIKNEVEVKVVKKDTKKEQTRNANKALFDKKAEKAAYEKQCVAAAIIKAAQEQKKKAKKQAKK